MPKFQTRRYLFLKIKFCKNLKYKKYIFGIEIDRVFLFLRISLRGCANLGTKKKETGERAVFMLVTSLKRVPPKIGLNATQHLAKLVI